MSSYGENPFGEKIIVPGSRSIDDIMGERQNGRCDVIIGVQDPDTGKSMVIELADSFDTVFNKLMPIAPPQNTIDQRASVLHTRLDGTRVMLLPNSIAMVREVFTDPDAS
jgi:hypothetical protein